MINRISIMSSIYVSVSAKISMIKDKVTTKSRIKIFANTVNIGPGNQYFSICTTFILFWSFLCDVLR